MLGLKILIAVLFFLIYVIMMSVMIIFERDKPKNIIIWSVIFLLTSVVGYIIYACLRSVFYKKKASLIKKEKEDDVYLNLVNKEIFPLEQTNSNDLFDFNNLAYKTKLTSNNSCKIFDNYKAFKDNLINELNKAERYILFEVSKVSTQDFASIEASLIERAKAGVMVKFVYDKHISSALIKRLKKNNIKVYKFSKYHTVGKIYANKRNVIIIDGKIAFLGNLELKKSELKGNIDTACAYLKLKGDIVQVIDLNAHKDIVFASGKYIPYVAPKRENYVEPCNMQFVTNEFSTDIELLIIKAICMAKKSIILQVGSFVPTESIMSLLRFAINSNIDVRLMVPIKSSFRTKYYASRAYAKELALFGANVYLFDGYINSNSIIIDGEILLYGSFILDREHLNTALQNVLVVNNESIVKSFIKMFNDSINNSYRISNAKYMLTREKFFKNFV